MTVIIPFTVRRGETADVLFDDADEALVRTLPSRRIKSGYAVSEQWIEGKRRTISLSRMLLGLQPGDPREGEHRNRNRLDNRRENLTIVTRSENAQNLSPVLMRSGTPTASRHRGVTRHRGMWRAMLQTQGKRRFLGYFDIEEDAAQAVLDALQTVTKGS